MRYVGNILIMFRSNFNKMKNYKQNILLKNTLLNKLDAKTDKY